MSCCCSNIYNKKFDFRIAREELNDYRKNELKKNSQPLLSALKKLPLLDATVLDIGGGIGALVFELFQKGIKKAIHLEISDSYIQVFREEAGT